MTFKEWLTAMFHKPQRISLTAKEKLTQRQLQVADRLADMKGVTRDEVLAEAYRRADKILKP